MKTNKENLLVIDFEKKSNRFVPSLDQFSKELSELVEGLITVTGDKTKKFYGWIPQDRSMIGIFDGIPTRFWGKAEVSLFVSTQYDDWSDTSSLYKSITIQPCDESNYEEEELTFNRNTTCIAIPRSKQKSGASDV